MSEDVVWRGTVDRGAWVVTVVAVPALRDMAVLRIEDRDGVVHHSHQVGLSFGAVFGPDAGDVAQWQAFVLGWLDARDADEEATRDDAGHQGAPGEPERRFTLDDAAVEWGVSVEEALGFVTSGRVRGVREPGGEWLVPVGEVARWQGVLGQNRGREGGAGRE